MLWYNASLGPTSGPPKSSPSKNQVTKSGFPFVYQCSGERSPESCPRATKHHQQNDRGTILRNQKTHTKAKSSFYPVVPSLVKTGPTVVKNDDCVWTASGIRKNFDLCIGVVSYISINHFSVIHKQVKDDLPLLCMLVYLTNLLIIEKVFEVFRLNLGYTWHYVPWGLLHHIVHDEVFFQKYNNTTFLWLLCQD